MKRILKSFSTVGLLVFLVAAGSHNAFPQSRSRPYLPSRTSSPVPGQPYERFTTVDRFGRTINFYLSLVPPGKGPLPIVAFIEGSGCGSRFEERNGRIRPAGGHIVVAEVFRDKARTLVVEKPGVKYLEQPLDGCREMPDFNRELTLERWAEANEAAIRAARQLPHINKRRLMIMGHSEGGLVACRVARDLPGIVTHVSSIAGGGPNQLFDLMTLARRGQFFEDVSADPEQRVQFVVDKWKEIQADPQNDKKFFFGFAFRRWSTFLASSPMEELSNVSAKIYLAQGVDDKAVDPASADALYAHLLAKGRSVIYDRVDGANHSFRLKDQPQRDGWEELFKRLADWFTK